MPRSGSWRKAVRPPTRSRGPRVNPSGRSSSSWASAANWTRVGPTSPMAHTNEPHPVTRASDWHACLLRTRTTVLNVLVAVGLMIALSGWLLQRRAGNGIFLVARGMHEGLLLALI